MNNEKWGKINEIFHAALDVEAERRLQFIEEESNGDKEIFAEVKKIVSAHEEAKSFIENPVANHALKILSDENIESIFAESKTLFAGQKIGRFEIVEKIGKGGMGEVFLARDDSLGRDVAIKILLPEFTTDLFRLKRFQLEAKTVSALNHPNILTIYEIGETEDFRFMATEFVKGKTLNQYLQTERKSLEILLKIAVQIVSALQIAHEAGIVHRDIKPENIMIRHDGIVKILDFGLAKLLENSSNLDSAIRNSHSTTPGLIMGTPNYMSPEQARGKDVDYQTDIFSFGVVLYEMLSGKLPFTGDTTGDIIASVLTEDPKSLSESNTEIPLALEKIVEKCLQKDIQNRYQTAKHLLQNLEEFSEDLQTKNILERTFTPNSEDSKTELLKKTTADNVEKKIVTGNIVASSNSLKKYLIAGLTAILIAFAGFFGYQNIFPSKQIESIAVLPFINESSNADIEYLSDGMTETLIKNLSNIPNLSVKARSSVFRYKDKETDLKKIASELEVQAVVTGRIIQRGEEIILSLDLVEASTEKNLWNERYIRKQSELILLQNEIAKDVSRNLKAKISGEETSKIANSGTANAEAYQTYLKGRYFLNKGTADAPQQALKYFQESVLLDSKFALGYAGIADSYSLIGTLMQSRTNSAETLPQAKTAAEKAIELDPNLSEAYVSLAWIKFRYDWDWVGAEKDFKKAIELNPNNAQAYQWYGELLSCIRRDDEAIAAYQKARDLEPFNLLMIWNLAKGYHDIGQFDKAISEVKKVYEMDKTFRRTYRILRQSYEAKKMYPEAFEIAVQEMELNKTSAEKIESFRKIYQSQGYETANKIRLQTELKEDKNLNASLKAVYYRSLNDKENMLYWLEEAYKEKQSGVLYLKLANYDFMKDDSRFQELLRKMNFPQ